MKIVMTGGGTGGHIYPALAIADKFVQKHPETEIIYIGSEDRLERDIVPKHGYKFESVDTMYLDRDNPLKLVKTAFSNMRGIRQAKKLLKKYKPDLVISTGGYISIPVVISASSMSIPIFIHEQNAFPGIANKFLEKYADKIFLGFNDARERFKNKDKLIYTGNPVRDDFYKIDKNSARKALGIDEGIFSIFIFGGSLGSQLINNIGIEIIKKFSENKDIHIMLGTGNDMYDEVIRTLRKEVGNLGKNINISAYINYIPNAISSADIVICRAGALSVAEITASGRPAIFIPSPNVTENHQYYNAKSVSDKGGAYLVEEDEMTAHRVIEKIEYLYENPYELIDMRENSKHCSSQDATEIIYKSITKELKNER